MSMTKSEYHRCGYGNFKKYKREFNKYNNWTTNSLFPNSLFGGGDFDERLNYYLHASIIKFDGKGMVLWNPIRASLYRRSVIKKMIVAKIKKERVVW
jgi:hypothetical protein